MISVEFASRYLAPKCDSESVQIDKCELTNSVIRLAAEVQFIRKYAHFMQDDASAWRCAVVSSLRAMASDLTEVIDTAGKVACPCGRECKLTDVEKMLARECFNAIAQISDNSHDMPEATDPATWRQVASLATGFGGLTMQEVCKGIAHLIDAGRVTVESHEGMIAFRPSYKPA